VHGGRRDGYCGGFLLGLVGGWGGDGQGMRKGDVGVLDGEVGKWVEENIGGLVGRGKRVDGGMGKEWGRVNDGKMAVIKVETGR